MEGVDIYLIAKNCRTSVEFIVPGPRISRVKENAPAAVLIVGEQGSPYLADPKAPRKYSPSC
jgi:hypothetical protein